MQENQHTRKLRETIEGYWEILKMSQNCTMAVQECDVIKKENQKAEYEKYLKLRVRPLMEYLIEKEDLEKIEFVAKQGRFSNVQLDGFIQMAGEKHCLSAFVCLLQWKKEICGFKDKDFGL